MKLDLEALGRRIFQARNNKNITPSEMIHKLNISQSYYSKIENGKVNISISLLHEISSILDVSISWLIGENHDKYFTDDDWKSIDKMFNYIKHIRNN